MYFFLNASDNDCLNIGIFNRTRQGLFEGEVGLGGRYSFSYGALKKRLPMTWAPHHGFETPELRDLVSKSQIQPIAARKMQKERMRSEERGGIRRERKSCGWNHGTKMRTD